MADVKAIMEKRGTQKNPITRGFSGCDDGASTVLSMWSFPQEGGHDGRQRSFPA
jgi:hypothetical protein